MSFCAGVMVAWFLPAEGRGVRGIERDECGLWDMRDEQYVHERKMNFFFTVWHGIWMLA